MVSVILGFSIPVFGQQDNVNIGELKNTTQAFYSEGNYSDALAGYSVLSAKYPGDVMYRYYLGVCLVKLNRNLDEAIEHLYYASSRGVPEDSYFYLGLAYHRDYNFTEAKKFFTRFEREGSRQQQKDLNVKHYINSSLSAADITAFYNPYKVLNVVFINLEDSTQFTQVKMRGGNLSRKPNRFFRDFEDRKDLTSLMFLPEKTNKGDYVYFAGYSASGKDGSQLFRVKKTNGRMWSDPQALKSLNSEMDEILPYFDPIESDLYFASDGRDGIGGFDLYKSHYDTERDEWSEPMNMGFPVNSVMDDYLLLPGNDLGMVMFFTSRESRGQDVTVYRVQLMEPKQPLSSSDTRKIKQIALLGGVAEEVLAEIDALENPPRKEVVAAKTESLESPKPLVIESAKPPVEISNYQITLAKALGYQAASDSLTQLATNARIKVRESDDPNDKWVWQKQIMVWEKKARDEQERADGLYTALNAESEKNQVEPHPNTIKVDTVINDITVYTYSEAVIKTTGSELKPILTIWLIKFFTENGFLKI